MNNNSKGFSILSVILVIVAIIVVISAWAMSGQSNANTSKAAINVLATTTQNQGVSLKAAYDQYRANGGKSDFNLTGNGESGNFTSTDPAFGLGKEVLNIKQNVLRPDVYIGINGEGYFQYKKFTGYSIFFANGITDAVCDQINTNLNGAVAPTFTTATNFGTYLKTPATSFSSGCIKTSFILIEGEPLFYIPLSTNIYYIKLSGGT